jgi:hypothetical protein
MSDIDIDNAGGFKKTAGQDFRRPLHEWASQIQAAPKNLLWTKI